MPDSFYFYIPCVLQQNNFLCTKKLFKRFIYILFILVCVRCAQITPLTGGKKDTTPPKPVSYLPANASVNFNSKTIEIVFDEFISLKDITNQFIITPQTNQLPDIQANGKKLKVTFTEALTPNTTYKLFFGDAIIDLHESNILKNFEYVFSTGEKIDSATFKGQVIDAYSKKPVSSILVGLYNPNSKDSIIYKEKPLYITKTNSDGFFMFNYLPNASFKIIAVADKNNNLLYDGSEEQLAFQDNQIQANDSNMCLLKLFKEKPVKNFIKKAVSFEYGQAGIIYNRPQDDITAVFNNKEQFEYKLSKLKDTVIIYYKYHFDTLPTNLKHQTGKIDTTFIKIPSKKVYDNQVNKGLIKYNIVSTLKQSMPFFETPTFYLNYPIDQSQITKSKISLYEIRDSVKTKKDFKISQDKKENTSFQISAVFEPETHYALVIDSAAISNETGRSNDSLYYNFTTTAKEDYAKLILKLLFPKKENYMVYILNEQEQIVRDSKIEFSLTSSSEKKIEFEHLMPGNYFIKIVEDANKNNAFDTGEYFSHHQPESVFINETPIKLLAGWEVENEWLIK